MSERAEVSFDAALMMALRADAQKELDELPSPAQLKERYPDTSRWDARLQAALHKHRPVLKRVLITVLTLVILTLGALAVSADFRRAVYTMIQKFLPIEMQLTYQVDGEPLEQLPNGYSDHYVPDGFERDYEQGYDNEISFLHAYVDANDKNIFYYVDCSIIQDYGQVETFDNEQKHFAQFSGSFTATVEQLLPDYYALPGKTVAVVHFFQDRPFLLHFQKDLTGELIEGTAYVFEFETFEVELPDDEENPNISDYMYSINVTNYRVAEDDELGLEGKMPTVEIVSK